MCDLAMSETPDEEFEKCGEIIVAPKRGVYAFCCHHCQDIFLQMPEFMRHLRTHDDVWEFPKNNAVEVYTVEELLNGRCEGLNVSAEDEFDLWNSEMEETDSEDSESDGEKCLNMSILKALEDCDLVPETPADVKSTPENSYLEGLNLSHLLHELEANDLTEIHLENLRDTKNLPHNNRAERVRLEETEDALAMDTLIIDKDTANKDILKDSLNSKFDIFDINHFKTLQPQSEEFKARKQTFGQPPTAKFETQFKETPRTSLNSNSKRSEPTAILENALEIKKDPKLDVQKTAKPIKETKIRSNYKSPLLHKKLNEFEENASNIKHPDLTEINQNATQTTQQSANKVNKEATIPTLAKNKKQTQTAKLKNIFSLLDDEYPELDNILDCLETSDVELNFVEDATLEASLQAEEETAVVEDFHETTLALDAMDIDEEDELDLSTEITPPPEIALKNAIKPKIASKNNKEPLKLQLSAQVQVEFKQEIVKKTIIKPLVESNENPGISVAQVNVKVKTEKKEESFELIRQLRRKSPRKTLKPNKIAENCENIAPANEENQLKNVLVKVQRLSPELLESSKHDNPPRESTVRGKTPLKNKKNDKQSFRKAVDANRLKKQNNLLTELSEKDAGESKSNALKAKPARKSGDKAPSQSPKEDVVCNRPKVPQVSAETLQKCNLSGDRTTSIEGASNEAAAVMPIETEMPTKTVFVKQNFTEASVNAMASKKSTISEQFFKDIAVENKRKSQLKERQKNMRKDVQLTDANTVSVSSKDTLNDVPETQAHTSASSRLRQRKASIDIVPTPTTKDALVCKTPRGNLDSQSYAVNRSARKKEVLQRMRSIKKQIFKSIDVEHDVPGKKNTRNVLGSIAEIAQIPQKPLKHAPTKVKIEKVEMLPSLNVQNIKMENMTPLLPPKRRSSSEVDNSLTFNDFKKPKIELVQRSNTRSNLSNTSLQTKLKTESVTPKRPSASAATLEVTNMELSDSVLEFLEHDLKSNGLNDKHIESILNDATCDAAAKTPESENSASGSVETKDELHLKSANDSDESQTIDNMLEQVISEGTVSSDAHSVDENEMDDTEAHKIQAKGLPTSAPSQKAADQEDLNLLDKVGLKIIKHCEDDLPLEEYETNHVKASEFALIFQQTDFVWHSRPNELKVPEKLDLAFSLLTQHTNETFGLQLTAKDLKRLSNLIILWYASHCNSKLLAKRATPAHVERYLKLFAYIPKTVRRTLICEYCAEQFRSESKYNSHRIEHTGAMPYACRNCERGFMRANPLRSHELTCGQQKCKDCAKKFVSAAELDAHRSREHQIKCKICGALCASMRALNSHQRETKCGGGVVVKHKCGVCSSVFSSAAALYTHSMTHLQKLYKCRTCSRVFAADEDLQRHMLLCCKREEQKSTPRPTYAKSKKSTNAVFF